MNEEISDHKRKVPRDLAANADFYKIRSEISEVLNSADGSLVFKCWIFEKDLIFNERILSELVSSCPMLCRIETHQSVCSVRTISNSSNIVEVTFLFISVDDRNSAHKWRRTKKNLFLLIGTTFER